MMKKTRKNEKTSLNFVTSSNDQSISKIVQQMESGASIGEYNDKLKIKTFIKNQELVFHIF